MMPQDPPPSDQPLESSTPGAGADRLPDAERDLQPLADLLDLIPDFFYVHNAEVRFQYANRAAAAYFGLSKAEIVGRLHAEVDRDPEQSARIVAMCKAVMAGGVPVRTVRVPYSGAEGQTRYLEAHMIPFEEPRTGERMLLGLSRDVTREHELEQERVRGAELERELSIARTIQQSLRPGDAWRAPGLDVFGVSRPAAYAGGDFYDWGSGQGGRFYVALGDVAGHGVGPALLAASCRAYARVLAGVLAPAEALTRLNARMSADVREGRFVTFALACVDPRTFEVEAASAGHGPLLVVRAGGEVEELEVRSPPLGVLPEVEQSEACRTALAPGDALLLVSDGVYEARAPGADGAPGAGRALGLGGLRRVAGALAGRGARAMVEGVLAAVDAHAGDEGTPGDDVTVVALARTGG